MSANPLIVRRYAREEGLHLVVVFPDGTECPISAVDVIDAKDINEAVFLALGAVSMCWDENRVFESIKARAFGEVLLSRIRKEIKKEVSENRLPNLGLATTRELLAEITSRIDVDYASGGGGLDYTTITGRPAEQKGQKKQP